MSELVTENLQAAQEVQKKWYDKKARPQELSNGEQVLVLLPTDTKKLFARWQGPYRVIKKIGKVNYQIEMTGKRKTKKIFHVNMLRQYHPSTFVGFVQETNCSEDGDGIDVWETTSPHASEALLGAELTDSQREGVRSFPLLAHLLYSLIILECNNYFVSSHCLERNAPIVFGSTIKVRIFIKSLT